MNGREFAEQQVEELPDAIAAAARAFDEAALRYDLSKKDFEEAKMAKADARDILFSLKNCLVHFQAELDRGKNA